MIRALAEVALDLSQHQLTFRAPLRRRAGAAGGWRAGAVVLGSGPLSRSGKQKEQAAARIIPTERSGLSTDATNGAGSY